MRYIMPLTLILLLAMACGIPTAPPTRTPPPTVAPMAAPAPTATDQQWLVAFESIVADQGVPEITNEMMVDACLIQGYFGWPETLEEYNDVDERDSMVVGHILSDNDPGYVRDVGIIDGSMIMLPLDLRKRLCAEYR